MTSTIIPPVDLAPGMPSRVVTISATDVTEGGQSLEGQMVRFALSDTLDVTSGGDVIAKTQAEVVLDADGEGSIRLPVYDEDVKTWCGQDWAILVTATWGSQKAIRVPAGTSSIALSALPPVRPLRGREKLWAITGVSVTVSESASAGGTASLSGGLLNFHLDIPRGDWNRGTITAGSLDDYTAAAQQGRYQVSGSTISGKPTNTNGWLEVWRHGGSGRTTQVYTTSVASATQYVRTKVGSGAWSQWAPLSAYPGLVRVGEDFNAYRNPGTWGVQSAIHPNQPAAYVGTLEVLPLHANRVLQRFTADAGAAPEVWERVGQDDGSSWKTWTRDVTQEDLDLLAGQIEGGGGGGGDSQVPRAALEAREATTAATTAGATVGALSLDRSRVWTSMSNTLSYSDDDGTTWTPVHTFSGAAMESTLVLDNGELLCTGNIGSRSRRVVWVSEGMPTGTPTFTEVLEAPYQGIKYTQAWSQSTHGRIVLLAEYGPKAGMAWPGIDGDVPQGEGAVRVHLSMDYGRTFRTIFNLEDYLVTVQGRDNADLQHLHGVAWDPYWDRIWVTFGDSMGGNGSNGVVFSDDLGETWQTAHYWGPGSGSPWQVVGILPMPRCVLFFGDMSAAVMRINRSAGKQAGPYDVQTAYVAEAQGKHLCQGSYRGRREGDDAPALAAFSTEGAAGQDFLLATLDGYTFAEVWTNPDTIGSGRGLRNPVGPTLRGQFLVATNAVDGTTGNWAQIRIPATGY